VAFPRGPSPRAFAACIRDLTLLMHGARFDAVVSHNRNASIAARVAARIARVPNNIYVAHGFYFHDDQSKVAREATLWLELAMARLTDYTMSQSAEDIDEMTRRPLFRLRPETLAYIGNGIDAKRFLPGKDRARLERQLGLGRGRYRIGTVGRIVRGKGHLDLLHAFARFRASHANDAELLLIGGNIAQDIEPFQEEFLRDARALGVENALRITGMVPNVEDFLATLDVFVLPSYREGVPRSLLEAMASGLPVVATDIRGCREAVKRDVSGLLYPAHDVDALARALRELHENPKLGARLGREARARVVAHYDEPMYVARQVDALERWLPQPAVESTAAVASKRPAKSTEVHADG
jgi:glycosyltransferase involved in cell wall biosynthesis